MAPPRTIPIHLFKPGAIFDRWTVITNPGPQSRTVLCRCDCGTIKQVYLSNLFRRLSKRCKSCSTGDRTRTHGASDGGGRKSADRLYRIWKAMKWRCNPKNRTPDYDLYYARGVRVCEAWVRDYPAFRDWALANGYTNDLTIDRFPNKDGKYEPDNCRWATPREQARNTRKYRALTAFGETKSVVEWAEDARCKTGSRTLRRRIERGWNHEEAIATPTAA